MRRMERIEEGPKVRADAYLSRRVRQVIQMGKSVGFTIPSRMAKLMNVQIGDFVIVTLVNRDQLVIEPVRFERRREDGERAENPEALG
jgi:antitoxin component of MazEF toxin-antitoxin module